MSLWQYDFLCGLLYVLLFRGIYISGRVVVKAYAVNLFPI